MCHISILTQPEGWMPPRALDPSGSHVRAFQSSPNPKVGCHDASTREATGQIIFQSSPNPKVGCHVSSDCSSLFPMLFQSSPNPKVGCHISRTHSSNLL